MRRRTFLASGSLAVAGYAIGGCATTGTPRGARAMRRAPVNLAPVRASFDRIIRTTVGLRPHRDAGFVLRAEKLDAKTLIHNYGHAGAGMSLAWGCGVMVAEFAQATAERRVAVVGCGSPGLTAARQLQGADSTSRFMPRRCRRTRRRTCRWPASRRPPRWSTTIAARRRGTRSLSAPRT